MSRMASGMSNSCVQGLADSRHVIDTGAKAKARSLLVHDEASLPLSTSLMRSLSIPHCHAL
jgi:hypothetical protein